MDALPVVGTRLADIAAGFLFGFGLWTVNTAIKRTKLCKSPLTSTFILMIWIEIVVNVLMGILSWMSISQICKPSSARYRAFRGKFKEHLC